MHQFRANILDVIAQFALAEPIRGEAVDDPENIAEFIVEARPDYPRRQGVAHIADAFADLVPDIGNFEARVDPFRLTKIVVDTGAGETA